ncbi:MAG TPA: cell division protein FtsL [Usitatibacteraceae bacterium]|nr:cell division protein FtsL [Usitatibacteraceae bacterium]
MTRLSLALLLVLVLAALSLVTAQHRTRQGFIELTAQQDVSRKLDAEWRELQIEAQTLTSGKRIGEKARSALGMQVPDPKRTVMVVIPPPGAVAQGAR